jgi:uncharacterized protein with PIN domain
MMKATRVQKKAELMAEAQALIEELLDWDERTKKPNLTQIEDEILALRERMGQRMAEVMIAGQEAVQPAVTPSCPTCGEAMRYKGRKEIDAESRLGALAVDRGYYYCARCEGGLFPPGPAT